MFRMSFLPLGHSTFRWGHGGNRLSLSFSRLSSRCRNAKAIQICNFFNHFVILTASCAVSARAPSPLFVRMANVPIAALAEVGLLRMGPASDECQFWIFRICALQLNFEAASRQEHFHERIREVFCDAQRVWVPNRDCWFHVGRQKNSRAKTETSLVLKQLLKLETAGLLAQPGEPDQAGPRAGAHRSALPGDEASHPWQRQAGTAPHARQRRCDPGGLRREREWAIYTEEGQLGAGAFLAPELNRLQSEHFAKHDSSAAARAFRCLARRPRTSTGARRPCRTKSWNASSCAWEPQALRSASQGEWRSPFLASESLHA